jgi:hypothetical protein
MPLRIKILSLDRHMDYTYSKDHMVTENALHCVQNSSGSRSRERMLQIGDLVIQIRSQCVQIVAHIKLEKRCELAHLLRCESTVKPLIQTRKAGFEKIRQENRS